MKTVLPADSHRYADGRMYVVSIFGQEKSSTDSILLLLAL